MSKCAGCGLFALAFLSDKSGHDEGVSKAVKRTGKRKARRLPAYFSVAR